MYGSCYTPPRLAQASVSLFARPAPVMTDSVVTRFAPSPTGFLHIGGARTALFNWLYAKKHGGKMLLRIEDTDRERSTEPAIAAILDGLKWLELDWNGEVIYQFTRAARHREAAEQLLAGGKAYRCYATSEELATMREKARAEGRTRLYDGLWRDRDGSQAPSGMKPTIRLRAPQTGETVIEDQVQGRVVWQNENLDDLVLLRGDGNPTYMLAVVVDDHDMGVTHVIRGDDHLINAARQKQIYDALGWEIPSMSHIPLIHGPDGSKLSKRHGALGVDAYRAMGYLPAALRNYLVRLGWSHGDQEIFSTAEMIADFDLSGEDVLDYVPDGSGLKAKLNDTTRAQLLQAMPSLKERAKTLIELIAGSYFIFADRPLAIEPKAAALLTPENRELIGRLRVALEAVTNWTPETTEAAMRAFAEQNNLKLGAGSADRTYHLAGDL
jgi:glutamyl-tRNA synthetase